MIDNLGLKSLVGKTTGAVGKVAMKGTTVAIKGTKGAAKVAYKGTKGAAKVAIKGTKQIGKTLTSSLGDSPDKRSGQSPVTVDFSETTVQETGAMGLDTGECKL